MFFTDTYTPQVNGVVTAIKQAEKYLQKLGHEVFVVCPKTSGVTYPDYVYALRSFTFKPYPEYRGALPSPRLLKWVKEKNPDIIHIHTPVSVGLLGLKIAKLLSKPTIATYHTLMEEYFKLYFIPKKLERRKMVEILSEKFIKKYTKFFYNRVDVVIVPSSEIKRILEECGVKRPIYVIPTGIDTKTFKPLKSKRNEKTILWVGRLGKEKSLDILLQAFKVLSEKYSGLKLMIVGDGPDRKRLEELAKKLGINTEFTGYVPNEKLPEIYSSAYVFVSPSVTETQGLTVLEAMACACPVVVANALGFKDYVKHGYNGFFAKPFDAKDFAEKIAKLIENKKLREKLAKNARKTAEEFSTENQMKKVMSVYEKLLEKPLVSIIIPALNEEKYIEKTLKSVRRQTYPKIEVIVVDNGSTDRTGEIAKKYANKVIVEEKRGIGIARNRGAKEAKGDILLFLDADTEIEKDCVEKIV
jgi:1,2-diacylglycerol 3-alpha-glucosyltransferase